ncbi:alpha/beta hydrolase [Bacillus sp. Marseille-P3661]|uniref:alpha/beta hydrolase n=1 Tax=Bacillus sp. Marseille-P3661 TaxID=1936234 RepID=UPI0015E18489|nr:alpha/beta hydrolase [Bacillus sp. Marseille-P3661]
MIMIESNPKSTIQKTLVTARLIEGFWDRWIAHGVDQQVACQAKYAIEDLNDWINYFSSVAEEHKMNAINYEEKGLTEKAELQYQFSGLYYNLVQWIFPERFEEKLNWYKQSLRMFAKADKISKISCHKESIHIGGRECAGRVRIPRNSKGSIIIINPIDSSKEELFTYEKHFLNLGFATVSFDGPGQGETFTLNGLKASTDRWNLFIDSIIAFTQQRLPQNPIFLFGTSSGASWAIKASQHPDVRKAVAVSPPVSNDPIVLPNYFAERLKSILEHGPNIVPTIDELITSKPTLLFHGNNDVMVKNDDIYQLYNKLPYGKKLIEYENETHCCNGKLEEIREFSAQWFSK